MTLKDTSTVTLGLVGASMVVLVGIVLYISSIASTANAALEKAKENESVPEEIAAMRADVCWIKKALKGPECK